MRKSKFTTEQIKSIVAQHTGVSVETMSTHRKKNEMVIARHLVTYYARKTKGQTLHKLKKLFDKNHATCYNSVKKISWWRLYNEDLSPLIQKLDDVLLRNLSNKEIKDIYDGIRVTKTGNIAKSIK